MVLLYHLVFPAKYRRAVFDAEVDGVLREVCLAIGERDVQRDAAGDHPLPVQL
jgi:REP element-mobilizing transposase RayT